MIAALYVLENGPYFGLERVDPWPASRDARGYGGPHPVVAHPPCQRWGRYWSGGPNPNSPRKKKGDDDGCFAAALQAVQRWGGVLEHPEASLAWREFDIARPPRSGGWIPAGLWNPGFTCCIEQGHYGHRSRKATWLYVAGIAEADLPELKWGKSQASIVPPSTTKEGRRASRTGACQRMSKRQRAETPSGFRDLLLSIARLCQ